MEPAIRISGINKTFRVPGKIYFPNLSRWSFKFDKPQDKFGLKDISMDIPRGSVVGFLGPNGAGKTTLIKIIAGLSNADSGTCAVCSRESGEYLTSTKKAKQLIGYLPERPYYHDFLSVNEFLLFHGRLLGMQDCEIREKIPVLLKTVGLSVAPDQKLATFSKGMLQRIGIAQAIIHDPEILIFDEPMSGLDPQGRREVCDIITGLAARGKTIFFSTHIIHDVEVICTSVAFIMKGRLHGFGPIESLLGKTTKSFEIRYALPADRSAETTAALENSKKTMDGWVLEIESDPNRVEYDVAEVIHRVLGLKGVIKSVVPRKSSLEDIFFSIE